MSTVTVESSRFGSFEIEAGAVIEFPAGLIGLGGRRWAVVTKDENGPFSWLHSLDDPALALPVTNPWEFFTEYEVLLSDTDSERFEQAGLALDVRRQVVVELLLPDAQANRPVALLRRTSFGVHGTSSR